jgi:uncharacterized protein (DUF1499 family)
MRNRWVIWAVVGVIGFLLPVAGLALLSLSARRPSTLGITEGRLAACPNSPNCVSSLATTKGQRVASFPLPVQQNSGENDEEVSRRAIERLAAIVAAMPRAHIVRQTDDYLHVEFTSGVFRFVDDVEFHIDQPVGVIQCRSASRVGRSDLGVNRRRVEAIRAALAESN